MDQQVRAAVTSALKSRGVDVLTVHEDRAHLLPDPELLTRATALGRVLFTQDDDFLAEAAERVARGIDFAGIIYMKQQRLTDREVIDELELIAEASDAAEWVNRVEFLPLK